MDFLRGVRFMLNPHRGKAMEVAYGHEYASWRSFLTGFQLVTTKCLRQEYQFRLRPQIETNGTSPPKNTPPGVSEACCRWSYRLVNNNILARNTLLKRRGTATISRCMHARTPVEDLLDPVIYHLGRSPRAGPQAHRHKWTGQRMRHRFQSLPAH